MMKPITGQYECQHSSGVGLDYFTSRVDRLTIQANGRFLLVQQDRSRVANAAQSLLRGEQVTATAAETRREGNYTQQNNVLLLHFDDGIQEQGQIAWNGEGFQLGTNFFKKVTDSTLLPPTHRMKKDMDDIAKGLKIAGTIGGIAFKAAKTIHETIQGSQTPGTAQSTPSVQPANNQNRPNAQMQATQVQAAAPQSTPPEQSLPPVQSPATASSATAQGYAEAIFCDQCGARCRPGKRFCNQCGARLD
ncbi:MAG: hypothetical protein E6J34_09470 [Chloroflexi bacterium]|nr:MAG: hypothetical protein E6J34_09470 [Chloroflexota bacterium]